MFRSNPRIILGTIPKMILLMDTLLCPPTVSTLIQHHVIILNGMIVGLILILRMMNSTHPSLNRSNLVWLFQSGVGLVQTGEGLVVLRSILVREQWS